MTELDNLGKDVSTLSQGSLVQVQRCRLMRDASLAATYWQQRTREAHIKFGDVSSTLLFNRLKQRQIHNRLYMLNQVGCWASG